MNPTDLENLLQSEIDKVVGKSKDVFSAVFGIMNSTGDFRWIGAAGTAYADNPDEMKIDTPIYIASITKMYTGLATMILEEGKLLSLDDPISNYLTSELLDGLHRYKGRDYTDHLRVYHLISQTSGLPDYFLEKPEDGKSLYNRIASGIDESWDVEQAVAIAKNSLSPKFPPEPKDQESSGKKAYYSDTNYQLLGAVIQSVAGKPYHEVISELIINPLELSATYFHGLGEHKASVDKPPANVYYKTNPLQLDKAMTSFGPDGGMVSNVDDSLKFLRNYLDGKLLSDPSTLERIKYWKKIFFPFQYGLGLMRFQLPRIFSPFKPAPNLIGHSGATSSFLFYSERDHLYIGGTLNQIENQGRPFRLMLKIMNIVVKAFS